MQSGTAELLSIITLLAILLVEITLWLSWGLRIIEVNSIFDRWFVDVSTWSLFFIAVFTSLILRLVAKKML